MFQKGNKAAANRPKISLTKPELLLPAIFNKGGVNWAADFLKIYRAMKERQLNAQEASLMAFYERFMPYLCTKVQLKELTGENSTPAQSVANAKQTSVLLRALESENAAKPSSQA